MVFYGASGHGKVVMEAWLASGGTIADIFDDNEEIKEILGHPVKSKFNANEFGQGQLLISIGDNRVRKKIAGKIDLDLGKVIHPGAIISKSVGIGKGTVVLAGAVINSSALIGTHVIINSAAVIEHDCKIGDFAHISPNVTLCGGVSVGEGTHVGAGATVVPGISIGKWVIVGAGSVVTKDIPDFVVVAGVPAKTIRKNDNVDEKG